MKKILIVLVVIVVAVLGYWQLNSSNSKKNLTSTLKPEPISSPTTTQPNTNDSMVHSIEVQDEKTFIQEMIPHHQEAIDTSKLVLAKTEDPELKKFTQDVITVQSQEITEMKSWLKNWFNEEYVVNLNYLPMMGNLNSYEGKELEKMYVVGMIRHHQGAIEMAKKVLTLKPRPEVKEMAEAIVTVQQTEVDTLQKWLDTKYQAVEAQDEMQHEINIH